MNRRLIWLTVAMTAGVMAGHGCSTCHRLCSPRCPAPGVSGEAQDRSLLLPPHPLTPVAPGSMAAPGTTAPFIGPNPVPPPPPPDPPPGAQRSYPPLPPNPLPATGDGKVSAIEPDWRPSLSSPPIARLSAPDTAPLRPRGAAATPLPQSPEPPRADTPKQAEQRPAAGFMPTEEPSPTPSLPVGISGFAAARERVTVGRRPLLQGLDWLQARGYRTVLYVRRTSEDDSSDQQQVTARQMRYVSLNVALPLSRDVVDQFKQIVNDTGNYPLFVYDLDGSLAGGMWYLYYLQEGANETAAFDKASQLGLKKGPDEACKQMWSAIEQFLEKRRQ